MMMILMNQKMMIMIAMLLIIMIVRTIVAMTLMVMIFHDQQNKNPNLDHTNIHDNTCKKIIKSGMAVVVLVCPTFSAGSFSASASSVVSPSSSLKPVVHSGFESS